MLNQHYQFSILTEEYIQIGPTLVAINNAAIEPARAPSPSSRFKEEDESVAPPSCLGSVH